MNDSKLRRMREEEEEEEKEGALSGVFKKKKI